MPRKIEITDKPGFSYFLSTPCESWDALEFIKNGIKTGGYIDDFWVRNANIKDAEVSARIRDIEAKRIVADKHLLMNERSRNILNETIEEHNKASEALSDFANVEYNARKKRKQNHQSDRYTSPLPPSPKLRNLPIELSNEADDVIATDDIPCELSFEHEDLVNEFFLGKTNVSQLFRIYQSESIRIAKDGVMIDIFGSPLLDKIYKELMPIQQIAMLRKAIKMANKLSDDATN
ncbi:13466_t:CDS:2 [Entrophospora sp. SA101]|nr:13466_t:CDS:2 [Entrophospora sp. SA101]